jgi:myo-inositol-hexaphosphate 3-phosphohydrolase
MYGERVTHFYMNVITVNGTLSSRINENGQESVTVNPMFSLKTTTEDCEVEVADPETGLLYINDDDDYHYAVWRGAQIVKFAGEVDEELWLKERRIVRR